MLKFETPKFGMSWLPRSKEDHIDPLAVDVYAFRLVYQVIEVFCAFDPFGFQVYNMQKPVVRRVTVRKEGIISRYIAIPCVDPLIWMLSGVQSAKSQTNSSSRGTLADRAELGVS